MKTFDDLEFTPWWTGSHAVVEFDNGYGISVLCSADCYSNGVDTFEVAVLKDGDLCYDTDVTKDVIGYATSDQITDIMARLQAL